FFALVYAAVTPGTWVRKVMQGNLRLRAFGVCSYSIYLFHFLLLFLFRYTPFYQSLGAPRFTAEFQLITGLIVIAPISYAAGRFSFRYIELPCVELGKRVIAKLERYRIFDTLPRPRPDQVPVLNLR